MGPLVDIFSIKQWVRIAADYINNGSIYFAVSIRFDHIFSMLSPDLS